MHSLAIVAIVHQNLNFKFVFIQFNANVWYQYAIQWYLLLLLLLKLYFYVEFTTILKCLSNGCEELFNNDYKSDTTTT